jgi:predicted acylesterase/phospholipase RssA
MLHSSPTGVAGEPDVSAAAPLPPRERDIILCLSGGGFRATFFHLGVLKFLAQVNLLSRVQEVFAVSGGSILAGHLGLHWSHYAGDSAEFDKAAREVAAFGRTGVRNKVIRSFYLLWRRRTGRYLNFLNKFYGSHTLADIAQNSDHRTFYFLATSAYSGEACAITSNGELDFLTSDYKPFPLSQQDIGRAVAASSAFPAIFNPVRLKTVKKRPSGALEGLSPTYHEFLMDGGVYDNLGIIAAQKKHDADSGATIIVSDASAELDWDITKRLIHSLLGPVSRVWRSTDVSVYQFM